MTLAENKIQGDFDKNQLENELQWIKNYLKRLGVNPQLDEVQSILHFALLWNLFEGKVCRTNANINKFENIVERLNIEGKLKFSNFESELGYFRSRYITNGKRMINLID